MKPYGELETIEITSTACKRCKRTPSEFTTLLAFTRCLQEGLCEECQDAIDEADFQNELFRMGGGRGK